MDIAGHPQPGFVFLTLFPDQEPRQKSLYLHRTYERLCAYLETDPDPERPQLERVLRDFLQIAKRFYAAGKLDSQEIFLDALRRKEGRLEPGYLYFRSFVDSLSPVGGLEVESIYRASERGRHYYGALYSKADWHPGKMVAHSDGVTFDPLRHFNVHFEPQFNLLNGEFTLHLHYETNPYRPQHWIDEHILPDARNSYRLQRERFTRALAASRPAKLQFGGRSNQIAKAILDLNGVTTDEAGDLCRTTMLSLEAHIDAALSETVTS